MELQSSSQMYGLAVTPKKCVWLVHFYIGGCLCCCLNDNVFASGGGYFTGAHMRTRSSYCKLTFSFLHVGGLMPPQIFQTCLQEGLNYRQGFCLPALFYTTFFRHELNGFNQLMWEHIETSPQRGRKFFFLRFTAAA